MVELEHEETFRIALRSRVYHADLLEAARSAGGVKKLAEELGISGATLSNWVLLKSFPRLEVRRTDGRLKRNTPLAKKWPRIQKRLFELTGKTTEQLFPNFVRLSGFLDAPKTSEQIREVSSGTLLGYQGAKALPPPVMESDLSFLKGKVEESIAKLPQERLRKMIEMRYGFGCERHTLEEIGKAFGIGKERVRALISKAEWKLRNMTDLKKAASEVLDFPEMAEA